MTELQQCLLFPLFAEGGICPPDTWAAGVYTKFGQSSTGSVVINAMLPRRHCLTAVQKKQTNSKSSGHATETSSAHREKEMDEGNGERQVQTRKEVWTKAKIRREDPVLPSNHCNSSGLKEMGCHDVESGTRKPKEKKQPAKGSEKTLEQYSQEDGQSTLSVLRSRWQGTGEVGVSCRRITQKRKRKVVETIANGKDGEMKARERGKDGGE